MTWLFGDDGQELFNKYKNKRNSMEKTSKKGQPVLTLEMADAIVDGVNRALEGYVELPRPVILTVAVCTLATYFGEPVKLDVKKDKS